jgi:hypothetical protein
MRRQDDRDTGTPSDALADNVLQRKLTENVRRRNEIWREAEQLFQMTYVASLTFLDRSCLRRIDLSWAIEFIESARLSHRFHHAYIPFWSPTPDELRRWDGAHCACRAVDDALGRYPDTRYDFIGLHEAIAREPIWHRVADEVVVPVARSCETCHPGERRAE